jgi:AP-3 complex subunit sigma
LIVTKKINIMIHAVLIFNNDGQPRLVRFYNPLPVHQQQLLLRQVHTLVRQRKESQSSFLTVPPLLQQTYAGGNREIRVIYRHYATLYFVFVVDQNESELGILDLIQVFVQVLNGCFRDVCELDLVFHWEVLQSALEETVQGGMVIDTSIRHILNAVDTMNSQSGGSSLSSLTENNTSATSRASSFFSRWPIT